MRNASYSFAAGIICREKKKGSSLCRCFGPLALLLCESSLFVDLEREEGDAFLHFFMSFHRNDPLTLFLFFLHILKCGTIVNACEADVSVDIFNSYRSGCTGAARKGHECQKDDQDVWNVLQSWGSTAEDVTSNYEAQIQFCHRSYSARFPSSSSTRLRERRHPLSLTIKMGYY